MWDNGDAPVHIIDHGVLIPPGVRYSGERPEGIVVVNHLQQRGRRLGADVFEQVRQQVPLQLVGMDSGRMGGLGEVGNLDLAAAMAQYRFFFNPIRYTSLGLAVIEAMMVGLPIIGLATTELSTVIRNGENGWIDTRIDKLVEVMNMLVHEPEVARRWGEAARQTAMARFNIPRFAADWDRVLTQVAGGAR